MGSRWPFQWTTGVLHLRATLHAKLDLPAQVGAQVGIRSAQWEALRAGQDVEFATEQLRSWFPLGTEHPSLPPDLDAAPAWRLVGDDELVPA